MAVAAPRLYPVCLEVDFPEAQSRWKALLRLPLSVPILIVLATLQLAALFATVAMWTVILATGRIPRWLFDFQVAACRFVFCSLGYSLLLTDRYPPFEGDSSIRYQ